VVLFSRPQLSAQAVGQTSGRLVGEDEHDWLGLALEAMKGRRFALDPSAAKVPNPEAVVVILVGSTHAARASLAVRPDYRWMAGELVDAGVPVVSLAPRWTSGSVAWNCVGSEPRDCHPRAADSPLSFAEGIHLEASDDGNYDGWFGVGKLEASQPAAFQARSSEVTATP
jgi:hypothetical protein